MGIRLIDAANADHEFKASFWHWRAIVEVILKLKILPDGKVEFLAAPYTGHLSQDEARQVARALRHNTLVDLEPGEHVLMNGKHVDQVDNSHIYKSPERKHLNYALSREELAEFADYCERCGGFKVE